MIFNIMANDQEWKKIIVKAGNTPEETQKLDYYTPTVEEMAMCFDINVVLDATSGPGSSTHPHKTDRVYIHLDSYPSNFKLLGPLFPDLLFGHKTSEDFYLMNVNDAHGQKNNQGLSIKSPEGFKVGFVHPGYIYIYPGVLEQKFWKEGEDKDILSIILYVVLPEAIAMGSDMRLHSHLFLTGYDNVRYLLRSGLDKENSKKSISSRLEKYLEKNLFLALQEMAVKMGQQQEEARKLAGEDHKLTKEIVEYEERLERVKDSVQLRNFGRDFDQILTIDKVRCVRMGEVNDVRSVVIFTDPIEQIPSSLEDERFDIGSFEIAISPNWHPESARSNVSFYQTRRVGKHRHYHANDSNAGKVCFGSMLNTAIDRLIIDFDIVPLTHLLMNFLIKESTKPGISDGKLGTAKIFPNTDIYVDAQDIEEERNAFSNFMRDILVKKSVKDLEAKVAELTQKRDELRKSRSQARNAIAIQAERIKETEREFGQAGKESASQAGLILEDKQVFRVTVNEEEILIYFNVPQIKKEFPRGNRGFVLRIARDQHMELIEPRKFEPIVLSNSDVPNFISAEQESTLFKWRARGNFSDIMFMVKEFIANGLREP